MTRTVMKPIVWNDAGYRHPTGGPFSGGYPAETGYGHEEWNHRPDLIIEHAGRPMKIFHTERPSKPEVVFDGQPITLHLYASRGGKQAIMSTAQNCVPLHEDLEMRLAIVEGAPVVKELWEDAWRLPFVQEEYNGDWRSFKKKWLEEDAPWMPTWLCPIEDFFAWELPIHVDGHAIKGARFTTRYRMSELLDAERASAIDALLPYPTDDPKTQASDVKVIRSRNLDPTTTKRLIDARRGQGQYRMELMQLWGDKCAVTGCGITEVLRASHIKPWRDATDEERLDPYNGLLLSATLDALFDRYLISFDNEGNLLTSPQIEGPDLLVLSIDREIRINLREETKAYLAHHREIFSGKHFRPKMNLR